MGFLSFISGEKNEIRAANMPEERSRKANIINELLKDEVSENINEEAILRIPAIQAILEITCGTIAQLPIYLYKDNGEKGVEIAEDKRNFLLNYEPNEQYTAYNFKKNIVKDYLIYGAHYVLMEHSKDGIAALYSLPAKDTTVRKFMLDAVRIKDADIEVMSEAGMSKYKPDELIPILKDTTDGLTGRGALYYGKEVFSTIIKEGEYVSNIYRNGAMPLGVLTTSGKLTAPAVDRLRASWQSLYGGSKNSAKTVILEEGLEYKPVTLNPKDLLLDELKKENISEVCRLFNIPESLINSQANKYGSLEQNNIAFLQYTLSPILSAIEKAFNRCLLEDEEKEQGYFFAFDTSEVLRTTEQERYEAIKVGLDSGILDINEARTKLNLPSIKDNIMKWSLGSVLYYPDTGEMKIPNMGIGIDGYDKSASAEDDNEAKVKAGEPIMHGEAFKKMKKEADKEVNKESEIKEKEGSNE